MARRGGAQGGGVCVTQDFAKLGERRRRIGVAVQHPSKFHLLAQFPSQVGILAFKLFKKLGDHLLLLHLVLPLLCQQMIVVGRVQRTHVLRFYLEVRSTGWLDWRGEKEVGKIILLVGRQVLLQTNLGHPSELHLLDRLVEELELLQLILLVLCQSVWIRELSLAILAAEHKGDGGSKRRCGRSVSRLGSVLFLNMVSQTRLDNLVIIFIACTITFECFVRVTISEI